MYSSSYGITVIGIDGHVVTVEVDVSDGLPIFELVGFLSSEVKEGKERVKVAIKNSGYMLGPKRITVNLSPGNLRKEGTGFDLSIAIAILSNFNIVEKINLKNKVFIGELGLNGEVKGIHGVLPMVYTAMLHGYASCYVPMQNYKEAKMIEGITIHGVRTLEEVVNHLNGKDVLESVEVKQSLQETLHLLDFNDVSGQKLSKRGIEVACAGMHNILLVGSPGSGKTMLASRISSITPDLTTTEKLEISKIYSVAGLLEKENCLVSSRPFRAPHHTITPKALTGGGRNPRPGELSLAHRGVLFLDEFPEFNRSTIEILRQPLEENKITISRVNGSITYPSDIQLVAAMNPCPCGYYPDRKRCNCTSPQIQRYLGKISRPILDRIDICVETEQISYHLLNQARVEENSLDIKQRIIKAHAIQRDRYLEDGIMYNSQLTKKIIDKHCVLRSSVESILKRAFEKYSFSARAYHRILKVARTIADLEGCINIEETHMREAIYYRSIDKKYWGNENG